MSGADRSQGSIAPVPVRGRPLAVIRYAKIHGTKHRPRLTALLARKPTKVARPSPDGLAMMARGERYRNPFAWAA